MIEDKVIEYKLIDREEQYMSGVAEIYNLVYPEAEAKTAEYFINKHFTNPVNDGVTACIALDGDKVAGAAFFVSGEYLYQNKIYKSALPCDYMVHPDYQRQGISKKFSDIVEEYFRGIGYDFLTTFPSPITKIGWLRNQWKEVFVFDYFILPYVPFLNSKLRKEARKVKDKASVQIGSIDIFDENDYQMLNMDDGKFRLKRSRELYSFKFDDKRMKHHYVKVSDNGGVKLLLAAREDPRKVKGIPITCVGIVDYKSICASIEDEAAYFALAIEVLRTKGRVIVIWESTDDRFNDMLVDRLNFKNLSKLNIGKSEHYYLVKALKPGLEVEDAKRWDLQWVDVDL